MSAKRKRVNTMISIWNQLDKCHSINRDKGLATMSIESIEACRSALKDLIKLDGVSFIDGNDKVGDE